MLRLVQGSRAFRWRQGRLPGRSVKTVAGIWSVDLIVQRQSRAATLVEWRQSSHTAAEVAWHQQGPPAKLWLHLQHIALGLAE
mmetsp:Transcript_47200/g.125372  ORF Transcript_47200/g.125372 Transcript_47200/m.125372 type:complete len:83 (+) Transcript_47200:1667-1915(+)